MPIKSSRGAVIERIEFLILKLGSGQKLALRMGYTRHYVNQIKNGVFEPSPEFKKRLDKVYNGAMNNRVKPTVTVRFNAEYIKNFVQKALSPNERKQILFDAAIEKERERLSLFYKKSILEDLIDENQNTAMDEAQKE